MDADAVLAGLNASAAERQQQAIEARKVFEQFKRKVRRLERLMRVAIERRHRGEFTEAARILVILGRESAEQFDSDFRADWQYQQKIDCNAGLDSQRAWLLARTAFYLQDEATLSSQLEQTFKNTTGDVGEAFNDVLGLLIDGSATHTPTNEFSSLSKLADALNGIEGCSLRTLRTNLGTGVLRSLPDWETNGERSRRPRRYIFTNPVKQAEVLRHLRATRKVDTACAMEQKNSQPPA